MALRDFAEGHAARVMLLDLTGIVVDAHVQVCENPISNAVKFTPPGGMVTVTAREDGEVVFSGSDTGIGIASDDLPHPSIVSGRRRGQGGAERVWASPSSRGSSKPTEGGSG